jgi:hypothetical protein
VPPETVDEKVTELPTSAGFWLDEIDIEGLLCIVTVTDADVVVPTESVMVTVRVYEPDVENEYEKSSEVETTFPLSTQE